uniref:AlNc14C90G5645 protein n=1 Tax=Albugo laibachii Nc14 TaxID=890382 RepID=F0WGB4_9STRA|nr:AlNc14C90G5645 [Albugo laibachii Nc14]|eukprot:CCA20274.1 AlNc14C90G5645 [Albugo laibachii Nc14]
MDVSFGAGINSSTFRLGSTADFATSRRAIERIPSVALRERCIIKTRLHIKFAFDVVGLLLFPDQAASGSVVEDLEASNDLIESASGRSLNLQVYLDVWRLTHTVICLNKPRLYLGDIEESLQFGSSMSTGFISEGKFKGKHISITFEDDTHSVQEVQVQLSQPATYIPAKVYDKFSSVLESNGFQKKDEYYGRVCVGFDDIFAFVWKLSEAPISVSFENGPTISITQYVKEHSGKCQVLFLPSEDGKFVLEYDLAERLRFFSLPRSFPIRAELTQRPIEAGAYDIVK